MHTYHEEVSEKRNIDRIIVERDKKMEEIKQLATSEQEQEQLDRYNQLHIVHRLLAAVVDSKGLRLIKKHREEQETFRFIKQNTNLSDINRMLERMESQDQIYENLLNEISSLEFALQRAERGLDEAGKLTENIFRKSQEVVPVNRGEYLGFENDEIARLTVIKEDRQA